MKRSTEIPFFNQGASAQTALDRFKRSQQNLTQNFWTVMHTETDQQINMLNYYIGKHFLLYI